MMETAAATSAAFDGAVAPSGRVAPSSIPTRVEKRSRAARSTNGQTVASRPCSSTGLRKLERARMPRMAYPLEPDMLFAPGAGPEGWRHDGFSQVATGVRAPVPGRGGL